jgi:hypothetical protein
MNFAGHRPPAKTLPEGNVICRLRVVAAWQKNPLSLFALG